MFTEERLCRNTWMFHGECRAFTVYSTAARELRDALLLTMRPNVLDEPPDALVDAK